MLVDIGQLGRGGLRTLPLFFCGSSSPPSYIVIIHETVWLKTTLWYQGPKPVSISSSEK